MSNSKKWSAEFLGTFWLTLGGCGSAVLAAAFLVGQQPPDPILLLPSAIVVTLVEASLARGLDNLAIPAVTALAFAWMF